MNEKIWCLLAPFTFPFLDSRTYLGTTQSRRGLLGCTGEEVKDRGRRCKPFEAQRDVHLQVHREYSRREITRDKSRGPPVPDFTMNVSGKNLFASEKNFPKYAERLSKVGNEYAIIYVTNARMLFDYRHLELSRCFVYNVLNKVFLIV